jgi:hypothetical protein
MNQSISNESISTRNYFAGVALQALLTHLGTAYDSRGKFIGLPPHFAAAVSFEYADAMMALTQEAQDEERHRRERKRLGAELQEQSRRQRR